MPATAKQQLPSLEAAAGRKLTAPQGLIAMARLPSISHTPSNGSGGSPTPTPAGAGGGSLARAASVGVRGSPQGGSPPPEALLWASPLAAGRASGGRGSPTAAAAQQSLRRNFSLGSSVAVAAGGGAVPRDAQADEGAVRLPPSSAVAWAAPTGVLPPLHERGSAPTLADRRAAGPHL